MSTRELPAVGLTLGLILLLSSAPRLQAQVSTLATSFGPTHAGYQGYYFDVYAAKNLTIKSFDIETDSMVIIPVDPVISVEVWTVRRGGIADGHQDRSEDWRLLAVTGPMPTAPIGTFIPLNLQLEEFIGAGETRGFYLVRHEMSRKMRGYNNVIPGTVLATNTDMTLSCVAGANAKYFYGYSPVFGTAPSTQVHYELHPSNPLDLRMERIVSPVQEQGCKIYGMEVVEVEVQNVGTQAVAAGTILSWGISVDNGPTLTFIEILPQAIAVGARHNYIFPLPFDFSALGSHQLDVNLLAPGDGFPGNDSKSETIVSGGIARVSSFPYVEDFESVPLGTRMSFPAGWEQDWADGNGYASDWWLTRDSASFCAPADHTTGVPGMGAYAYCEDESTTPFVKLRSPCIDLTTGINAPRLSFWWALPPFSGTSSPVLSVDVIEFPSGTIHTGVGGPYTMSVRSWTYAAIDLNQFKGKVIQLQFHVFTHLFSNGHDIGIDDIRVFDAQPTPGQSEQPGLASLRIGEATNANGDPQYVYTGGPYFVGLDIGDPLVFEFEGQPNQPIIFLTGLMNPQAATFPNIGSMDIGGLPDPITGIPIGLSVLADGTSLFGLLNPFFVTDSSGSYFLSLTMPAAAPGPIATFQSAFLTDGSNGSWVALSNAIELSTN